MEKTFCKTRVSHETWWQPWKWLLFNVFREFHFFNLTRPQSSLCLRSGARGVMEEGKRGRETTGVFLPFLFPSPPASYARVTRRRLKTSQNICALITNIFKLARHVKKTKKTSFAWRHPCICTLIDHGPITTRVVFILLHKINSSTKQTEANFPSAIF